MGKERSYESRQIIGIRWAVGVQRCTDADDRTRRDPGERSRVPPSITWILLRPPERQDRYSRSTCRGYLVMSFPGSSNRLAVTLRHLRQVMRCSAPPPEWARTRSIWLSRRRPSPGNHPTSPLRRRHRCRWHPKLRGRGSSPVDGSMLGMQVRKQRRRRTGAAPLPPLPNATKRLF